MHKADGKAPVLYVCVRSWFGLQGKCGVCVYGMLCVYIGVFLKSGCEHVTLHLHTILLTEMKHDNEIRGFGGDYLDMDCISWREKHCILK